MNKKWQFWVDRGGTFTDLIARKPSGELKVLKLLSQSDHYSDAVVEGIKRLMEGSFDPDLIDEVRMGTTVATNAFLQRRGSKTAFITTHGFKDLLEIRQQDRPELFALNIQKIKPLYHFVSEVSERISASGEVISPLNEEQAFLELKALKELGAETLSVSLMHSTVNPVHELKIYQMACDLGFSYISLSHQVSPIQKIISRAETSVMDAYLSPKLSEHTEKLSDELGVKDILFMQSHAGLCAKDQLKGHNALLSGPAGGYIGAARVCERLGYDKIITFDMGGTSTDVAIYDGSVHLDHEPNFHGLKLQVPMLDIHTVAAGGGSILFSDGQRLSVGPDSAGALPGPACYGNGGPLTITDANLFLGRVSASQFPAIFGPDQDQPLDEEVVKKKFESLAAQLNEEPRALAKHFLNVAVETMAGAIRKVSVNKGLDPKDFVLCSFGGAGAQVACLVADRLSIDKIFIHPLSSVLSAFGMGLAEEKHRITRVCGSNMGELFEEMVTEAKSKFTDKIGLQHKTFFQIKMKGSDHFIEVEASNKDEAILLFKEKYHQTFGINPEGEIQIQALSVEVFKSRPYPQFVFEKNKETKVIGPEVILGNNTSIVIDPGWQGELSQDGAWILKRVGKTLDWEQRHQAAELEIFYQRFQAIAEEMGHVLRNAGYSVNIKERLDYSCALFTKDCELIANAPHMPVHLGSMSECVLSIHKKFSGQMKPGDCFISNSPMEGGTHLPDITLVSPVFYKNELVFYVASRGHHADVGGIAPGSMPSSSTRLEEEGIIIPARKFLEEGHLLEVELKEVFLGGPYPARNFNQNLHDLKAQLAANTRGISTLLKFIEEAGIEKVNFNAEKLLSYTQDRLQHSLKNFKEGHGRVDLENNRRIEVHLSHKDRLKIDFTGTSLRDPFNFNAPKPIVKAAVLYCLRCLIEENIPLNDGLAREVDIHIPEDSLLNPQTNSAVVAGNVETSQAICDAIFEALGVLAHSQGTMNNLSFGNENYQYYETLGGGSGAGQSFHGASAVQVHMTNSRLTDPEVLESRFPVRLQDFSIRGGSGGKGKFNGGDGLVRRIQFLEEMECNFLSQNREFAPLGLSGGEAAMPGENLLIRKDGHQEHLPACFSVKVNPGDQLCIATPGGGGAL